MKFTFPNISIFNNMSDDMGIDLGTANTLVHCKDKGIIIREPSVVAVEKDTNEVLAIGAEAKRMIGRTPGNIVAIRPMKDGVIADYEITQSMLKYFIKQAMGNRTFVRPRILVGVPSGVTEVEKRAVIDATIEAGAREAYLIEEPMAAAIGACPCRRQPVAWLLILAVAPARLPLFRWAVLLFPRACAAVAMLLMQRLCVMCAKPLICLLASVLPKILRWKLAPL